MILQALKEYYDRVSTNGSSNIAPEGWETKELPYIIVLNPDGTFHSFESTTEIEGKKKRAKSFLVPLGEKKAGSKIIPNLLWDSFIYIFGIPSDKKLKTKTKDKDRDKEYERAKIAQKAFIDRLEKELGFLDEIKPILFFLKNINFALLEKDSEWEDIKKSDPFMSFKIVADTELICRKESVIKAISNKSSETSSSKSICLVTGDYDEIERIHASIKGVLGAQSSGGNIVSFNFDSAESYGKHKAQGLNAPVGKKAAFAYTTALNSLLSKDSKQRLVIGDSSTVFWSEKQTDFESDFAFLFTESKKDDPSQDTEKIEQTINSIKTGKYIKDDGDTKFFILGLSPNAARISIRFWFIGKIKDFANNIDQYFKDLEIVKPENEPSHYSIWRLLVNVAVQDQSKNIPPNLAGDMMKAILTGQKFPDTLLQAALRRIRSDTERRVKPVRAALIKAYLNRTKKLKKELTMSLDKEQPSIGYQLGRLFATLAKIQAEAQGDINSSITDRYYASACASPVTVFSTLLRLKNHHISKIENKGRATNFEKLIGEIISHINKFPSHLNIQEQGLFAIGYYHQWQDFFTKKSENNEAETTAN